MAKFNLVHRCATDQYCGRTDCPSAKELAAQRIASAQVALQIAATFPTFTDCPLFSIIVPLYRTPIDYLLDCVGSVLAQTYSDFELVLVNGDTKDALLAAAVDEYAAGDARIKVVKVGKNGGIVGNTNAGIRAARGQFVCFLDHDDKLEPDALFCYAQEIATHPQTDMLYCDEDLFRGNSYFGPLIKPDFNLDLLRSQNYIVHFLCIRRELLLAAGLSPAYVEGAQDLDAAFKGAEHARRIARVPHVLYHWRSHAASISADPASKSYSEMSGLQAVQDHLARTSPGAIAKVSSLVNVYDISYAAPSRARVFFIDIGNSLSKNSYAAGAAVAERFGFSGDRSGRGFEIAESLEDSDFILITHSCTPDPGAVESMVSLCARPSTGAVTARVQTKKASIVSAGAKYQFSQPNKPPLIKMFAGLDASNPGYEDRTLKTHELSVATDAILIKSPVFAICGGLPDCYMCADYKIADLALSVNTNDYLVVYDAASTFTINSHEGAGKDASAKAAAFATGGGVGGIRSGNRKGAHKADTAPSRGGGTKETFDELAFIQKWDGKVAKCDKADNPQFSPTSPYCALAVSHFARATAGRIARKIKGVK